MAKAAPPTFTLVDLGTLGGDSSTASRVNSNGQVVGNSFTAGDAAYHAFSWTQAGGMVDLGTLDGSHWSSVLAVNDNGQVVGVSNTSGDAVYESAPYHAFSWTQAGGMIDLGTLGGCCSQAWGVNDNGQVVGNSTTLGDAETHAFSWTQAGGMKDLGTLGGCCSQAFGVNDNGQVVGNSTTSGDAETHAFSWTQAGGFVDLGTFGGGFSDAVALNGLGQVVGFSVTGDAFSHAFSWTAAGGIVDIGTFGGSSSQASAVSGSGQVVGFANTAGDTGYDAFSWTRAGGIVDLGTLGGSWSSAGAVNDTGEVVGGSLTSSGNEHAFSWTQAGGIIDLGTLGGVYAQANAVNGIGQIAGESDIAGDLETHATLWQPNATAPAAPSGVAAAAGDGSAAVSWLAPASDGGSAINSYTVTASPGGATATVSGSQTSATVPGLTDGRAYTFTVTATNGVGTGPASAPSNAVTPQAGNEAAAGTASPTATTTVSTGNDPASTGGTTSSVTVPPGTSGGTVTIDQTATTEPAPSGFQLGNVQVVISAPAATATNPLTLVFTITPSAGQTPETTQVYRTESDGTPTLVSQCDPATQDPTSPSYKQAIADPCVWDKSLVTIGGTSYIQVTVLTSHASAWNQALPRPGSVNVSDSGYSPSQLTVQLGASVNWKFLGSRSHSVTESVGLGPGGAPLFDSGAKKTGTYSTSFRAAGSYAYKSAVQRDTMTGSVLVPVLVTRSASGYVVVWATSKQTGYVFDVQYRFLAAGSKKWTAWTAWKTGVATPNAIFVPSQGAGTYSLRARLRNVSTGKASDFSPQASFTTPS